MNITETIARELNLKRSHLQNAIDLLDEGNTVPFIARYRKEATGEMSDETLREIEERLAYLRHLEERKKEVIRLIDEQGKLTEELQEQIQQAQVLQRVEDLYKPYKQKKATRASKAKEKGLEPLAELFWAQEQEQGNLQALAEPYVDEEKGVADTTEAIAGAMDILAEKIADHPELTAKVREKTKEAGFIVAEAADSDQETVYQKYYDFKEEIERIPNHRILAINRGEKEKKLKVKITAPVEMIQKLLEKDIITNEASIFTQILKETAADAYKRLMAPSIEREMRNKLTERAEKEAVKVFAVNTQKLLMVPPVQEARIISIDPGYRTGCKVAVLDQSGKLLDYTTVYPTQPKNDINGTEETLKKLIKKFNINIIVIGNGTGGRETEEVVAAFLKKENLDISYTIVNEAGASVYSASKLATEEYPDLDVTTRGAMSLGRRLQDPLAELVKIPTKSIGVGQYQHDINQNLLETALNNVVEDCVNKVGVDLNTASPSLLSHIAGINMPIAKNIVSYREEKGTFSDRKELKKVAKLGEKTFNQCAGFLRIAGGKNPLDSTSVHPESYQAAEALLQKLNIDRDEIHKGGIRDIEEKIIAFCTEEGKSDRDKSDKEKSNIDKESGKATRSAKAIEKMAEELNVGAMTLKDIVEEIKKPGRDPRESAPAVVFRNDVRNIEDLAPDMTLTGTVRNVVDFGAFIDIGLKNDGLVHISQISNKFIKHPMDVLSIGDTVKVKVLEVDQEKQKISLSMKL